MEQVESFAYRPSDLSSHEMRLDVLQPRSRAKDFATDDRHGHIQCNIVHSNLFHRPQYEALSYVWNSPEPTQEIIIAGNYSLYERTFGKHYNI